MGAVVSLILLRDTFQLAELQHTTPSYLGQDMLMELPHIMHAYCNTH